jgi:hypothetical protein
MKQSVYVSKLLKMHIPYVLMQSKMLRNICISKNVMLMYWYLFRQFAIDTVNSDSQKLVQFLSVNVRDSSPKYFRCLLHVITTWNQIDAE